MMREGREQEQAALGTGKEALAAGLLQGMKAILQKNDKGQPFIEGSTHYLFLTGTDGGRYQDSTIAGSREQACLLLFQQLGCYAAGYAHAHPTGGI